MLTSWKTAVLLFIVVGLTSGYFHFRQDHGPGYLPDAVPASERAALEARFPATVTSYEDKKIPLRRGCSSTWDITAMKTVLRNGADDCIGKSDASTQCNELKTAPFLYSDLSPKKPWPWESQVGTAVSKKISVIPCPEFYVLQVDTFVQGTPKTFLYGPFVTGK